MTSEKAKRLRKITAIFLIVALTIGIGWDVFVAVNDVSGDTISELTRDLSHDYWILPFALMGVMGHFFLNVKIERPRNVRAMVIACVLVGGRDLVNYLHPLPTLFYANFVVGAVGFVAGAWWWPQIYTAPASLEKTSPDVDVNAGDGPRA